MSHCSKDHEEEGDIVPDCRAAQILADLPPALERERRFDVTWHRLLRHNIFLDRPTDPVSAPPLEPHWDWLGPKQSPWPDGTSVDAGIMPLCLAFCRFLWRRNRDSALKTSIISFFMAFTNPILAVLAGLIVDELNEETSVGDSRHEMCRNIGLYSLGMFLTFALNLRAEYQMEVDVPQASQRFHLRHMVMKKLIGDHSGDNAPHPIARTPGAATAILGPVISTAVNKVWGSVFPAVQIFTGALLTLAATLFAVIRSGGGYLYLFLMTFLALLSYVFSIILSLVRQRPIMSLTRLKMQWQLRYYSLGAEQLDCLYGENKAMPPGTEEQWKEEQLQAYGDAAFVYRKRDFQAFFIQLVATDLAEMCNYAIYIATLIIYGIAVVDGRLTVGMFTTITAASANHLALGSKLTTFITGLPEGAMAIQQLAEIINYSSGVEQALESSAVTEELDA